MKREKIIKKNQDIDPIEKIKNIKQSVVMRGRTRDMISFVKHLSIRKKIFRKASKERMDVPYINILAKELHPGLQRVEISAIEVRAPGVKSFRLKRIDGSKVAPFQAGQYIVVEEEVDGIKVSRPFSISCSPEDSLLGDFYEITIKEEKNGFLSKKALSLWQLGLKFVISEPMGFFYYESLRDQKNLLCFAGGSGVTPFRSMIPSLLSDQNIESIALFYGFSNNAEFLFKDDFIALTKAYPDRFKLIPVLSEISKEWDGETGFITPELISRYAPKAKEASWFICGPRPMKEAITKIFENWDLRWKNIRFENFTPESLRKGEAPRKVKITVHCEGVVTVIEGSTGETVVSSLDSAGLNPPVYCRSGDCGWCRSRLISGRIEVPKDVTGVRKADIDFGWFHPCSSFPLGDLEIRVNRNPLKVEDKK